MTTAPHRSSARLLRRRRRWIGPLAVLAGGLLAAAPAAAEGDGQAATWSRVESSEAAKKYFEGLKKGEFDGASQAFLEQVALPQLAAEGNRRQIERVRRRMRDMLLSEKTSDAGALERAAKVATDWLVAQASNAEAEPALRVNAMLLVGELRGKDGKPWSGALGPLAATMADAALPPGVRVAAAAGLARHVDVARAGGAVDPAVGQQLARPLLAVIAAAPTATDGVAGDWLVSRALDMLPAVAPKANPEAAKAMFAILADAGRRIDVRVRAAAALGTTATSDSAIDAADAVARIRSLAAEAVKSDIATAAERALTARLGGQTPMAPVMPGGLERGMPPGFPPAPGAFGEGLGGPTATLDDPIDELVVRRDAWRLMTLATAVAKADGGGGLAALLTDAPATWAKTVAKTLRDMARALDESPDTASMKEALAAIERLGRDNAAGRPAAAAAPTVESPAGPDPFGAGN